MKRQQAPVAASHFAKKGEGVAARQAGSLLTQKAAAKKASASSRANVHKGRSPFGFVPADAPIKVSRWPKL
jgi:hypothetical protein